MGNKQSYNNNNNNNNNIDDENQFTAPADERKKIFVIERKNEFPSRLRSAISKAKDDYYDQPEVFLSIIRDELADYIIELAVSKDDTKGLNDERDTEQQVELAIRFFPEVLFQRRCGLFPIFWLSKSMKAISFIPLFAKLGTEFDFFRNVERGGLIFGTNGMDVFSQLASTCANYNCTACKRSDEEHQQFVDKKFLAVLQRLRKDNLMTKTDIREFNMIDILCKQTVFPEQRFKYLVDWDPSTLLANNGQGGRVLSLRLVSRFFDKNDISGFRMFYELAMNYYPLEIGFIFHKMMNNNNNNNNNNTSIKKSISKSSNNNDKWDSSSALLKKSVSLFHIACEAYGEEQVRTIVDSGIYTQMKNDPNFTRKALIHATSCEESIRMESVYILLHRDPTICKQQYIQGALTVRAAEVTATATANYSNTNGNGNYNNTDQKIVVCDGGREMPACHTRERNTKLY